MGWQSSVIYLNINWNCPGRSQFWDCGLNFSPIRHTPSSLREEHLKKCPLAKFKMSSVETTITGLIWGSLFPIQRILKISNLNVLFKSLVSGTQYRKLSTEQCITECGLFLIIKLRQPSRADIQSCDTLAVSTTHFWGIT